MFHGILVVSGSVSGSYVSKYLGEMEIIIGFAVCGKRYAVRGKAQGAGQWQRLRGVIEFLFIFSHYF